jgi:hypothetical protein
MPRVEFQRASVEGLAAVAERMRAADALEVKRSLGVSPEEALRISVSQSDSAGLLYIDGEPACAYGLAIPETAGAVAVPWMLTTDVVEKHRLTFFRIAKVFIDSWAEKHPVLLQLVDVEYVAAQEFLKRCGFRILPPVKHGPEGAFFVPAVRGTTNV